MSKYDPEKLPRKIQEQIWDELCYTILSLDNIDETRRFFRDLLNRTERTMLSRRLEIAILLKIGLTYQEIINIMGTARNTISKVDRLLNFGRKGYQTVIRKMQSKSIEESIKKYHRYYSRRNISG